MKNPIKHLRWLTSLAILITMVSCGTPAIPPETQSPEAQTEKDLSGWQQIALGDAELTQATLKKTVIELQGVAGGLSVYEDHAQFSYQVLKGNGSFSALINMQDGATAGLMLRSSLQPNASSFSVLKNSAESNLHLRLESELAALSRDLAVESQWLKIERLGTLLIAFTSSDGESWLEIAREELQLSEHVYLGFVAFGPPDSISSFENIKLQGFTNTVEPLNLINSVSRLPLNLYQQQIRTVLVDVSKPENATKASFVLTALDPDNQDEGELYINGNGPVTLFGSQASFSNDSKVASSAFETPVNWWLNGQNELEFRHIRTGGFRVDKLELSFEAEGDSVPNPTPNPEPSPTPTPSPDTIDFPIRLTSYSPESKTVSFTAAKPAGTSQAVLNLISYDADNANEGSLFINGNGPLELFAEQAKGSNDSKTTLVTLETPANWWQDGQNQLEFSYIRTAGYFINGIEVEFKGDVTPPNPDSDAESPSKVILHQQPNSLTDVELVARNASYIDSLAIDGISVQSYESLLLMKGGQVRSYDLFYKQFSQLEGRLANVTSNYATVFIDYTADLFDDAAWQSNLGNWQNLAKALRDAGVYEGILFDNEEYLSASRTWMDFPQASAYEGLGLDLSDLQRYKDQARLRGREIAEAVKAVWPDIKLISLHGPYVSEPNRPSWLTRNQIGGASQYEMLGPLFIGMAEGLANGNMIDGGEVYQYRSASDYEASYVWRKETIASAQHNSPNIPSSLRSSWADWVSIGFGLYNQSWPLNQDPSAIMNESIMENSLYSALNQADDLVWVYLDGFDFYGGDEPSMIEAIAAGRARHYNERGGLPSQKPTPNYVPETVPAELPAGDGLRATYFDFDPESQTMGSFLLSQVDSNLNYETRESFVEGLPVDEFCVVWEGWLDTTDEEGIYRLEITTDDGARLYTDNRSNVLLADRDFDISHSWQNQDATSYQARLIPLEDYVPLRIEYYEATGTATFNIKWHTPSMIEGEFEAIPLNKLKARSVPASSCIEGGSVPPIKNSPDVSPTPTPDPTPTPTPDPTPTPTPTPDPTPTPNPAPLPSIDDVEFPFALNRSSPSKEISFAVQKPSDSETAVLALTIFDADFTSEGELFINGLGPILLFAEQGRSSNNDRQVSVQFETPASYWIDGLNTLRFTHLETAGYRVDGLSLSFSTQSTPNPEPTPQPTPSPEPTPQPSPIPTITGLNYPINMIGAVGQEEIVRFSLNKPENIDKSTLILTVLDADNSNEGELYLNGQGPIVLFGSQGLGANDSKVSTIRFEIDSDWWINGTNTIRLTHTRTAGYRVDAMEINLTELSEPTVPSPEPSPEPETPKDGKNKVIIHQQPRQIYTSVDAVLKNAATINTWNVDGITVQTRPSLYLMRNRVSYSYTDYYEGFEPLKSAFSTLDDNYISVFSYYPGDLFDDSAWQLVTNNFRNLAKAASDLSIFEGIYFDNEEYGNPNEKWGSFGEAVYTDLGLTQADLPRYRDQAKQRGREIGQAISLEWPAGKLIAIHGPYGSEPNVPDWLIRDQLTGWQEHETYEIRDAFFVGMAEGMTRGNLIDGGALYQYRTLADYQNSYDWRKSYIASSENNSPTITGSTRSNWSDLVSVSFGLYNGTWPDPQSVMTDAILGASLENALNVSDTTVWVYLEEYDFYGGEQASTIRSIEQAYENYKSQ